jgi:hypothetical protein
MRLIEAGQAVGFLPKLACGDHAPTVTLTELTPPTARRVLIATRTGSHDHPAVVAARIALDRISRSHGIRPGVDARGGLASSAARSAPFATPDREQVHRS